MQGDAQSRSDTTKVGFAFGVGDTSFNLSDGLGGGRSSMFDAGFYASTQFDAGYVTAGLAYGFHDVTTDRYVTIAGIDHLRGNFGAHNIAGQIEAGYEVGLFTPYAAVRGYVLNTPSYAESTVSGQSTFALNYAASTALTGRTEIGTKFDWTTPIGAESTLDLHARVAWLHAFGSNSSINAAFQLIPNAPFTVQGATAAADSLLLSLGSEISIGDGVSLAASVDSELSATRQTYGGSVRLGGSW